MERFAPAALPQNLRAKTNLRSVGVKRRVVGEPADLRPPFQQLHVEGADRAIGGRGGRDPVQNCVCLAPTPFGQSPCWLMAEISGRSDKYCIAQSVRAGASREERSVDG